MTEHTADHVRSSSPESANERIDREARDRVREFSRRSPQEIDHRIAELTREWDIERYLEMNAATIAFTGVAIAAAKRDVRWLVIPSVVLPFLFQHATQGWCPPVPFFRAKGIRTRGEIDREIYALKALRGDFNSVESADVAWSVAGPSTSPLLS